MAAAFQYARGSFEGTGALITIDKERVGFKPSVVKLVNISDPADATWQEGMGDDAIYSSDDADTAFATSGGIIPTATGFSLGTHAINTSGERIFFEAWG